MAHQNSKQPRYNFRNYECTFVLEKLQNQPSVKHSRQERTRAHSSTTVIAISNNIPVYTLIARARKEREYPPVTDEERK